MCTTKLCSTDTKQLTLNDHDIEARQTFNAQMAVCSGGDIESDISNIDIFVNVDIVSKQMRKYRYFDI